MKNLVFNPDLNPFTKRSASSSGVNHGYPEPFNEKPSVAAWNDSWEETLNARALKQNEEASCNMMIGAYDNIGNRETAQEAAQDVTTYATNPLNQYSSITQGTEMPFAPEYDTAGNQTKVKTSTGIWTVTYDANNRPTSFTSEDGQTVISCGYDFMGRRFMKKVTVSEAVTLHQFYLYRGYLQIAALDLTRSTLNALWFVHWDPTEPVATRPLSIRKNATWYTYGHDLTKNVSEFYTVDGTIATAYDYTPYGAVTATGIDQPFQWSSEIYDAELGMVYYNYRHYNPMDGRWTRREPLEERGDCNLYRFIFNYPFHIDYLGLNSQTLYEKDKLQLHVETNGPKGNSTLHLHLDGDKYDYRTDKDVPGFYNRETGQNLPKSIRKKLVNNHEKWDKAMKKAADIVEQNNGLSPKFGGGKILGGVCLFMYFADTASACADYCAALQSGDIGQMDQIYGKMIENLPDIGTLMRSAVWDQTRGYHEELKTLALECSNE